MKELRSWAHKSDRIFVHFTVQSSLDYPDSLGPHEIVQIIENMNINEEQNPAKLIRTLRAL